MHLLVMATLLAHGATLEATISGMPAPAASEVTLSWRGGPTIPAARVVPVEQGSEPIAVAFVMNGQELFVGDDRDDLDCETPCPAGVLPGLADGFERTGFATLGPKAQAIVVTYSTGAQVRFPMSPIAQLTGKAFGTQKDYYNRIGSDMVQGIDVAIDELEKSHAQIKALIVIGDGNDTDNEIAVAQLPERARRAARDGIQTYAVIYKTVVSSEGEVITKLTGHADVVNSVDGLLTELARFRKLIAQRFAVTFDDPRLPFDGVAHDFVMRIRGADLEPMSVAMPDMRPQPTAWWQADWKLQIAAALGVLALIAVAMRIRFALSRR